MKHTSITLEKVDVEVVGACNGRVLCEQIISMEFKQLLQPQQALIYHCYDTSLWMNNSFLMPFDDNRTLLDGIR